MNVVDFALAHAQQADLGSYALAFAAGIATSIGPCVAPRYAAVAAIAGSTDRAAGHVLAFVTGTITVYIAVATIGSIIVRLVQASPFVYWTVALVLIVSGIVQLARRSDHECAREQRHVRSFGAAFVLGAATSTTVSPCCTPILLGFAALTAAAGGASVVAGLVTAFTVGHIAPVLLLFAAAGALNGFLSKHGDAVATVGAAVTIALGLYYALLA